MSLIFFKDEVLAVRSADEDSDSDNKSDLAVSDIEGQEDDDLPDIRAWGKDKRKYYQTDYVDPDYGGFQGKDAQLAEFEEEEARLLQKQLAEQLDDDDFALDIFAKVNFYSEILIFQKSNLHLIVTTFLIVQNNVFSSINYFCFLLYLKLYVCKFK